MCLVLVGWHAHRRYPLVVAANRAELHARPTAPLAPWSDHPGIVAGRDLEAGGTWLGLEQRWRFAAITNYRDPDGPLIKTHFKGTARALSDATLAWLALVYPFMTIKVVAGIHFEALKLWLKRIPLTRRPWAPRFAVSSATAADERG